MPANKIVIVGDGAIGKTCLIDKFTGKTIDWDRDPDYEPTTFQNFVLTWDSNNPVVGSEFGASDGPLEVELWDTAGQESFAALRTLSYPGTSVYLLGYSCISNTSVLNIRNKWIPEVQDAVGSIDGTPWTIVVGTKKDLWTGSGEDAQHDAIFEACKSVNACAWIETSAKDANTAASGVDELHRMITRLCLKKMKGESRPDWVEPAANEADSSAHAAPRKNEKAVAVHNFKTLIVGDGAIGKTCLTSRFTNNSISWDSDPEYEPTTFQNFIIEWEPGNPVVGEELGTSTLGLEFWDTAGQEAFAQLRKLSYPGAGIVLVGYSCVSKISLKNVANKWMEELNSVLLATEGTPWTILVGTKKDMRSLPGQEVVSLEEGQAMAKKINAIAHVETSAKMEDLEASGVNEMLRLITKYALMKIRGVSRPNWIAPGAAPAAKVSVPLPAAKPPVQVRQFKTVIVGDGAIGKTSQRPSQTLSWIGNRTTR